jgi:hypothetical protein
VPFKDPQKRKEYHKKYSKDWWERHPEKSGEYVKKRKQIREDKDIVYRRKWHLLSRYGMSLEDYDKLFNNQKGVCAICGGINESGRRLAVDHNHKTDEVRGLLCDMCNHMLGSARDDIQLLLKAIQYLSGGL